VTLAEVNVHDSVDVPEVPRVTLVGVSVHVEVLFVVRFTVPVKPLSAVTVIVELPAWLVFTLTDVGLADKLKPGVGPVPVTVTVIVVLLLIRF
jgi:hypothetical protein